MPTVFVTQEVSNKNIQPAKAFGDLVIMLPPGEGPLVDTTPTVTRLEEKMRDITSDDYLLLIGDPVYMATATAMASDLTSGRFQVLKWDRQEKTYIPVLIDIYEI